MLKVLASAGSATNPFGSVDLGSQFLPYGSVNQGLVPFFTNILRLIFMVAGVYAFINLIIAGFEYMTAAGDPKKLTAAFARIWQSLIGLVIIAGSFALAALFSYLIFHDAGFILNPKIYGPATTTP